MTFKTYTLWNDNHIDNFRLSKNVLYDKVLFPYTIHISRSYINFTSRYRPYVQIKSTTEGQYVKNKFFFNFLKSFISECHTKTQIEICFNYQCNNCKRCDYFVCVQEIYNKFVVKNCVLLFCDWSLRFMPSWNIKCDFRNTIGSSFVEVDVSLSLKSVLKRDSGHENSYMNMKLNEGD